MRSIIAFFLFTLTAQAEMKFDVVNYKDGSTVLEGVAVYDRAMSEKRPAVLIVHDWMGLTDKTKKQAQKMAELGYVVFAADIYGQGVRPTNADEAAKEAGKYKTDRDLFRRRLNLALKEMKKIKNVDSKKLAAAGYCFGGTGVIELARSGADIKAVVSFHGGLDSPKPELGKKIRSRVLALHGADDPYVPAKDLEAFESEMRDAKVDWQLIKYGNAVHSFTDISAGNDNSKGAAYNASADRRSWQATKEFLAETFGSK